MNLFKLNRTGRQFSALLFSNYVYVVLAFVTNILMTHAMHETEFGYYKYALTIIAMSAALINGGLHHSAARLVAISDRSDKNPILHTSAFITLGISGLFAILGTLILVFINKFFIKIELVVFLAIPLVFSVMFQKVFTTILKGDNRILDIIFQVVLPHIFFLSVYIALKAANTRIDFETALLIYGIVNLLVHLFTWMRLKIRFPANFIESFKEILQENKTNGFQLYKGSIAGVFIGDLLTVIVGGAVEKSIFGMYSLALSLSAPIYLISRVMGTIKYKDNANQTMISKKNIWVTIIVSIVGLITLNVGVNLLFPVFFEARYSGALEFLLICSVTYLIHGLGDYFNQFSASHGLGKELKNGAYITGAVQLVATVILAPSLGITGLLIAKLISSTVYCGCMLYIYLKHIGSNPSEDQLFNIR